jgi:hypothetical protein
VHSTADLVCWCLYRLHPSKDSRQLFSTDGLIAAIQVENMTPPPPPTDEKPLVLLAQPLFPEFAAALSPSYRLALAAEQTVAGETRPAFRHPSRRARRFVVRQDARGVPASVKTRAAFRRPARRARRSNGLRDALGVPAPVRCPRCSSAGEMPTAFRRPSACCREDKRGAVSPWGQTGKVSVGPNFQRDGPVS